MSHSVIWRGKGFAEGLRWHDGALWFSDMRNGYIFSVKEDGSDLVERAYIPGKPSGLGWRPDGQLLVSSMLDGYIVDATVSEKKIVADIGDLCPGPINDLIVDAKGRAYIGSLGFHPTYGGIEPADLSPDRVAAAVDKVPLIRLDMDGSICIAAEGLIVPNGMVQIHEGRVLVIAETPLQRLTAFDIAADGGLSNRHIFAELPSPVDGICADREGAVWASQLMSGKFVRVAEGGEVLDEIETPGAVPIACVLGGGNGDRLFGAVVTGAFDLWSSGHVEGEIWCWPVKVPA